MKVFLDANIMFSLAWKEGSALNKLFEVENANYFTSGYAKTEAERNLSTENQIIRLEKVLKNIKIFPTQTSFEKIKDITLKEKDLPILNAAIELKCEYLITGDFRDFGQFYGHKIEGVIVLPPREFLTIFLN
jgi:predicted nucleic acid-binding protein